MSDWIVMLTQNTVSIDRIIVDVWAFGVKKVFWGGVSTTQTSRIHCLRVLAEFPLTWLVQFVNTNCNFTLHVCSFLVHFLFACF